MRTQIAKTWYLPTEYIPPTFSTRTPLPFLRRFIVGAAIEKNFFIFFVTSFLSDSYSILFRISVVLTHYKFSLDILLVWFRYIFLDYNFGFCVFRFWISTRFYSLNFTCFNLCRFYALTLLLVIKNIYVCTKFTSSLFFSYFKAFWRVFVCFRCSLSSVVKIKRQKA